MSWIRTPFFLLALVGAWSSQKLIAAPIEEGGSLFARCIAALAQKGKTAVAAASPASNRARLGVTVLEARHTPYAPYSPYNASADLFEPTSVAISFDEDYGDPSDESDDPMGTLVYVGNELVDDLPAGVGYTNAFDLPQATTVPITLYSYNDDGVSDGTTIYVTTGSYATPPGTPTGLYAITSSNDATLYWGSVENAESYRIYVNGSYYTSNTNSLYLYNLAADSAYTVFVIAENSAGTSGASGDYTFYTEPPPIVVPNKPTLVAGQITTSSISLSVAGGQGADYFELEKRGNDGQFHYLATMYLGSAPYVDSGLSEFTPVEYRVRAVNAQYRVESTYTFRTDYTRFLNTTKSPHLVVASAPGSGSLVQVFDTATKQVVGRLDPFPGFEGAISVATGDVNGDTFADLVVGAGEGGGPHVKIYDGKTGRLLYNSFVYHAAFLGGVQVALGDVNGDGLADLITGAGPGGGPHVRAIDVASGKSLVEFYAYDVGFGGGVRVAAGKFDDSGKASIVTGAGAGGGPHVRVWTAEGGGATVTSEFMAYDLAVTSGVYVSCGDLNGDGRDEVLVGVGHGGGPHFVSRRIEDPNNNYITFMATDPNRRNGIVPAFTMVAGKPAIVGAEGKGGPSTVSVLGLDGEKLFDLNLGLPGLNGAFVGGN